MSDDVQGVIDDWFGKLQSKINNIENIADQAVLKSALYCEQKAKQYAQDRIYTQPIPTWKNGHPKWKRTGLYKASIGSSMNPNEKHSAILYNTVKYAPYIEYGTSRGIQGKYILNDAVFKNTDKIRKILKSYIIRAINDD